MIDVMDSKPLQGCKLSFKGIAQGRMKNSHSLVCLGAIEAGPQDTEQLFNDWVSEVETFDERSFREKKGIVEQVKRSVPADRLLVHSAKEVESRLRITRSKKYAI